MYKKDTHTLELNISESCVRKFADRATSHDRRYIRSTGRELRSLGHHQFLGPHLTTSAWPYEKAEIRSRMNLLRYL